MILNAKRVQGLQVSPVLNKKYDLIKVAGPGVFVSAFVTKQGGSNGLSQVALFIDGVNVVALNYVAADNMGLDEPNNSGIKLVKGVLDNFTIQFNEPLFYKKECRIEYSTGSDAGVSQIIAVAVLGSNCSYPA